MDQQPLDYRRELKLERQTKIIRALGNSLTFVQKLRMAFNMLDEESKGFITLRDLSWNTAQSSMLKECGVFLGSDSQAFAIMDFFRQLDHRSDGHIRLTDFIKGVTKHVIAGLETHATRQNFKALFDQAKSQTVSVPTVRDLLRSQTSVIFRFGACIMHVEKELKRHDGKLLDFEEFCSVIKTGVRASTEDANDAIDVPLDLETTFTLEEKAGKGAGDDDDDDCDDKPDYSDTETEDSTSDAGAASAMIPASPRLELAPRPAFERRRESVKFFQAQGRRTDSQAWALEKHARRASNGLALKRPIVEEELREDTTTIKWAKNPTVVSFEVDGFDPQLMEDEDEADLDDGSEGDQDNELSLVHGIRPLASTADMEAYGASKLKAVEMSQLIGLQKLLASMLFRETVSSGVTFGRDAGGSDNVGQYGQNESPDGYLGLQEPIDEIMQQRQFPAQASADAQKSFGGRSPSEYEITLTQELLKSQVENRKLTQLLKLARPDLSSDDEAQPSTDLDMKFETTTPLVTKQAVEKRMNVEVGNLLGDTKKVLANIRSLVVSRSSEDHPIGALVKTRHVIAPPNRRGVPLDATANKLASLASSAQNAQRREKVMLSDFEGQKKRYEESVNECKKLRVRLEELDADRHEFDELSLQVHMLRDQLRIKQEQVDHSLEENRELRRNMDKLIHATQDAHIKLSFPDGDSDTYFRQRYTAESDNFDRRRSVSEMTFGPGAPGSEPPESKRQAAAEDTSEKKQALETEMAEMNRRLDNETEEHVMTQKQLERTEDRLHTVLRDLARQRDQHQDDENEKIRLNHLVEYLKDSNGALSKENDRLLVATEKFGATLTQQKKEKSRIKELERDNEKIIGLTEECRQAVQSERLLRFENTSLKHDLKMAEATAAQLEIARSDLAKLAAEKNKIMHERDRLQMSADSLTKLQKRHQDLSREVETTRHQLSDLDQIRAERDRLQGRGRALENALKHADQGYSQSQEDNSKLREQARDAEELHVRLAKSEETVTGQAQEIATLKDQLTQMSGTEEEIRHREEDIAGLEEKLQRANNRCKTYANRLTHAQIVNASREEEMKKVTEKNEKLERENEAMRLNNARDNPAGRKTTPR